MRINKSGPHIMITTDDDILLCAICRLYDVWELGFWNKGEVDPYCSIRLYADYGSRFRDIFEKLK